MYWYAKNQFSISLYNPSSDTVNFRVPSPDWLHPFLTIFTPKIFNHLLICVELYQHAKNHFHHFFLEIQSILYSRDHIGHTHFWTCPTKKFSLIFVNLYQHAKNEAVSSICSGEMLDLNILESEWLRTFLPISQEQHFFQREDLYRNKANNKNLHYRANSGKINDHIFL